MHSDFEKIFQLTESVWNRYKIGTEKPCVNMRPGIWIGSPIRYYQVIPGNYQNTSPTN